MAILLHSQRRLVLGLMGLGLGPSACIHQGGLRAATPVTCSSMNHPSDAWASGTPTSYGGTFVHCPDLRSQEIETVLRSIDALQYTSWLARVFAAPRLRKMTEPPDLPGRFTLTVTGTHITMVVEREGPPFVVQAPASGAKIRTADPDGDPMQASFKIEHGAFEQTFHTTNGERIHVSTLDDSGLLMTSKVVTMSEDYFVGELSYTLHFCRVPQLGCGDGGH